MSCKTSDDETGRGGAPRRRIVIVASRQRPSNPSETAAVTNGIFVHTIDQLRLAIPGNSIAAVVFALVIAPSSRRDVSLRWLAMFLASDLARFVWCSTARRSIARGVTPSARLLSLFCGLASVVWGALPLLFSYPGAGPEREWQVLAVSTALTMAATTVLAGNRRVFVAWALPMWLMQIGLVTGAAKLPDAGLFLPFGASALLAMSVMYHVSTSFLVDTVLFRHRNAALVAQLEASREQLAHDATHDVLTGLLNRAGLIAAIDQALVDGRSTGRSVGVIFVDLDRFKMVNDTLGHAAGDFLLRTAATRLNGLVDTPGVIARLGGDEFVVLVADDARDARLVELSARIESGLQAPYAIHGETVAVAASAGWAAAPGDEVDAADLLGRADRAMYEAKRRLQAGRLPA